MSRSALLSLPITLRSLWQLTGGGEYASRGTETDGSRTEAMLEPGSVAGDWNSTTSGAALDGGIGPRQAMEAACGCWDERARAGSEPQSREEARRE